MPCQGTPERDDDLQLASSPPQGLHEGGDLRTALHTVNMVGFVQRRLELCPEGLEQIPLIGEAEEMGFLLGHGSP